MLKFQNFEEKILSAFFGNRPNILFSFAFAMSMFLPSTILVSFYNWIIIVYSIQNMLKNQEQFFQMIKS